MNDSWTIDQKNKQTKNHKLVWFSQGLLIIHTCPQQVGGRQNSKAEREQLAHGLTACLLWLDAYLRVPKSCFCLNTQSTMIDT